MIAAAFSVAGFQIAEILTLQSDPLVGFLDGGFLIAPDR